MRRQAFWAFAGVLNHLGYVHPHGSIESAPAVNMLLRCSYEFRFDDHEISSK